MALRLDRPGAQRRGFADGLRLTQAPGPPERSLHSRRALCSSAARRLPTAAGALRSVPRKPWRSPGAASTFGCAWLQRWHLSWRDSWWVSARTPSPSPLLVFLPAAAPQRGKRGAAVLGLGVGSPGQLSPLGLANSGISAKLETEWNAF